MPEFKDISLGTNAVILKGNRVTTSILPKNTAELERNIKIEGNVIAEGAVYANELEITTGPAKFCGAVFASKELHINNDSAGLVHFIKSAASSASVAAFLSQGRAIFGADVNSPSIKLKNCMVCGSLYGGEIQLENCVVLGGVFASKTFAFTSCMLGTFNAPEVSAGGINYILYPTAFSVEPMSLLPGTELWNLSLADLGSIYKGDAQKPHTGKIKMDMTHDTLRTVLSDDSGAKTLVNSYSVAGRVLVSDLVDLEKLENHFLIVSASLGPQLLKQYSLVKADGEKGPALEVERLTEFFFALLAGKHEIPEVSGAISFDELKKKFD